MERMEKTLDSVRGNFNTVRTGRASPSLLDRIEVRGRGRERERERERERRHVVDDILVVMARGRQE